MQVFNATWIEDCTRAGYRVPPSQYILSGIVCLYGWLVTLKLADALPIENENIDVVPYQVSSLRPYVPPPSVDSFSPSGRSQLPTPHLVLVANSSPLKETDRSAHVEIEETSSSHSSISEKQVEQAILGDHEDTPSANGVDSSGETLVENSNLPTTREEPR